jgi:hypothetical protein
MKHGLLAVLMALAAGVAQAKQDAPTRLALLIGNWDYNKNGKFDKEAAGDFQSDLLHPCKDIVKIEAALRKVQFGDIDVACNVSKPEFEQRIADFARKVEALPKGSLAFIYYTGHGAQQLGYLFSLPVLYRHPDAKTVTQGNDLVRHLSSRAVDVQTMLGRFPERKDLAIYIALDQCRSAAVLRKDAYNEMVNVHTAENVMIQYSTTPGQTSPDPSEFSSLLVEELLKGGDIGSVASRVYGRSLSRYEKENSATYSTFHAGLYFSDFRSPALSLKAAPDVVVTRPEVPDKGVVVRRRQVIRPADANPALDIIWCEGEGERERYAVAVDLADKLAKQAKRYGVGRIAIRPLSVDKNLHQGYNVWRNLMRFDMEEPKERGLLERISADFSDLALLPLRGAGYNGEPTKNYVSAFICAGFAGR